MPYNIPGETPTITRKMDRCVADLIADPGFKPRNPGQDKKSAAIAVCKTTMMRTTKKGRSQQAVVNRLRK